MSDVVIAAPTSIKVLAFRYTVHFDRAELATAQKDSDTRCLGATNHDQLVMVVDPLLPLDQQADTLLHEVEHCIFHAVGIGMKEKLTEHEVIERTNTLRLSVLRENPELVRFLVGEAQPKPSANGQTADKPKLWVRHHPWSGADSHPVGESCDECAADQHPSTACSACGHVRYVHYSRDDGIRGMFCDAPGCKCARYCRTRAQNDALAVASAEDGPGESDEGEAQPESSVTGQTAGQGPWWDYVRPYNDQTADTASQSTACKSCGHVRYSHHSGRWSCVVPECACAGYRDPIVVSPVNDEMSRR